MFLKIFKSNRMIIIEKDVEKRKKEKEKKKKEKWKKGRNGKKGKNGGRYPAELLLVN